MSAQNEGKNMNAKKEKPNTSRINESLGQSDEMGTSSSTKPVRRNNFSANSKQNNAFFKSFRQNKTKENNESISPLMSSNIKKKYKNNNNGKPPNFFKNYNIQKKKNFKDRKDHAGLPMKGFITDCLICCQRSDLFAIGSCLHPICMECAIRIRILGKSNLCPQCRTEINSLYFVSSQPSRKYVIPETTITDSAYSNIYFETHYSKECFKSYLAHKCIICLKNGSEFATFPSFPILTQHLNQIHSLSFCFLCNENVNALTKDRIVYNLKEIQKHMNGNESFDSGFKGHPKCFFCEERFYDDEQQFKHLRKEHYFCQICDEDGVGNYFYKRHRELSQHYKKNHFPCLDPECLSLGIVFRSDAKVHCQGRKLIKLDFQLSNNRESGASSSRNANITETQNIQPVPPPALITIVPSAQSTNNNVRIVPSAFNIVSNSCDFPNLNHHQQPLQNWKLSEQFPDLPSTKTSNTKQNCPSNSVWNQGNSKQLFKEAVKLPEQRFKEQETEKRKKFIPSPDCFPEGMREVLKARQSGLPDPVIESMGPSYAELFEDKKKTKKKKNKTLSKSAALQCTNSADFISSSTTRFKTLCSSSEEDHNDKPNWWSSNYKLSPPKLKKTSDNFVQIDLGSGSSKNEILLRNGKNKEPEKKINDSISLRSIAALLEKNEEIKIFEKKEDTEIKQCNKTVNDELFLLQHARLENCKLNNDYGDDNELDLALALEMSMLSDSLFLPQTKNQEILKTSNNLPEKKEEKEEVIEKNKKPNILSNNPPPGFSDLINGFNDDSPPPGFSKVNEDTTDKKSQESNNNVENNKKSWTDSIMSSLFRTT